jgi:hypothetical protein
MSVVSVVSVVSESTAPKTFSGDAIYVTQTGTNSIVGSSTGRADILTLVIINNATSIVLNGETVPYIAVTTGATIASTHDATSFLTSFKTVQPSRKLTTNPSTTRNY